MISFVDCGVVESVKASVNPLLFNRFLKQRIREPIW
jgi:hypothetical protein